MIFELTTLSVLFGFICTEFTGLLTGGLVSAGYLAFFFNEPMRILSTLLIAVLITFIIKGLQHFMILYGRRRFAISIMLSLLSVWAIEHLYFYFSNIGTDLRIIGFIIPGLIASDMLKQGILKTLGVLMGITLLIELLVIAGV